MATKAAKTGAEGGGEMQAREMVTRPDPDPTLLTTQQLLREIALLREVIDSQIKATDTAATLRVRILETRLEDMDKAIALLHESNTTLPEKVDEKINALKQLHAEKFESVQTQFRERDTRGEQTAKDSKVAVDAALQAAKEAVGEQNKSSASAISKSETGTDKRIEQLSSLIATGNKTVDDKIVDVKDRLTRIEGRSEGADKTVGHAQISTANILVLIGVIFATLLGIGSIVIALLKH